MFVAVDENYFSKIFEGEERLSNVTNRLSSVGIEKKKEGNNETREGEEKGDLKMVGDGISRGEELRGCMMQLGWKWWATIGRCSLSGHDNCPVIRGRDFRGY